MMSMLPKKRVNVLVYAGNGCSLSAVHHCISGLRRLLSPNYAVIPIDGEATLKEPWLSSCALFVMPGGADLGYCQTLNGAGNSRISTYVRQGGAYLGFCAGGYYGSRRCEFEVGNKDLEVVGDRQLAFFPGVCRGLAFPGFAYNSERGTRASALQVSKSELSTGSVPETFRSYYNGGGVFVDAESYGEQGVRVLAEYVEQPQVESGTGKAAAIYSPIGDGHVILTCTHIEFVANDLCPHPEIPGYDEVLQALREDEFRREDFLFACLCKLGLRPSETRDVPPELSDVHISSRPTPAVSSISQSMRDAVIDEDEARSTQQGVYILRRATKSTAETLGLLQLGSEQAKKGDGAMDNVAAGTLRAVIAHEAELPDISLTPYFNHNVYYAELAEVQAHLPASVPRFGTSLLYGETVTSTNTLLEKNMTFLRQLPMGFTATATTQLAGRGRGSNIWVSPPGSLLFSVVIRHPASLASKAPVIFLQYLAALSVVKAIRTYGSGFENVPVKLKWPNDIYALDPTTQSYAKIGGILVNSHYNSDAFLCVVGIGLNVANPAPTTSLNALRPPTPFTLEKLLARVVTSLGSIYHTFHQTGFNEDLEDLYYQYWLHNEQIVTVETEGGAHAIIRGITRGWGFLKAEELGPDERPTGKMWQLQSDSNSFDFFKGLLKRKI